MAKSQLYDADPRDIAIYGPTQAARYVRINPTTLRSWFFGRPYATSKGPKRFDPLLEPASTDPNLLSFNNLIEAFVLSSLRRQHSVPMKTVREALEVAAKEFHIERPLLRDSLRTSFGELFIKHYGRLRHLRKSEQLVLEEYFVAHAKRVDLGEDMRPIRYYPFLGMLHPTPDSKDEIGRPIVIDPNVGFGQPTITGSGVSTYVIAERIDAGETVDDLAADYGITPEQIHAAIIFDQAA